MDALKVFIDWTAQNPGKTTGAFLGFIIGILIFTLGIIPTLVIVLLALIGFVVGKSRDDNLSLVDEIAGWFKRKGNNEFPDDFDDVE